MGTQRGAIHLVLILVVLLVAGLGYYFYDNIAGFFGRDKVLAASATDTSYNMGVYVISYFPLTANGQNIDIAVTGDVGDSFVTIKQRTVSITNNLLSFIPKSTKYLGYKNAAALPAINLQLMGSVDHNTAVPMLTDGTRRPNYNKIMTDHGICNLVDNMNVREVWIHAYQGPVFPGSNPPAAYLGISESKMAGPFGDISNSPRYNDMPVCQHSYRVYTFNYGRGTAEALHSWGHQIEAELSAIDNNFYRNIFQGPNYPKTLGVTGRCGSVHNPPNARFEYDYGNDQQNPSDCLDWDPNGMVPITQISCSNWGCQDISDSNNTSLNYMIWMWQNLPGRENGKVYQGRQLRNWWDVHGNFDGLMGGDRSLFVPRVLSTAQTPTVQDGFNRANGVLGTTETGQNWEVVSGGFAITDNKAHPTTCGGYSVVNAGAADGVFKVKTTVSSQDGRMPFRLVDANNFYFVERDGGGYHLEKMVNGTRNFLGQIGNVTPQNGDVIEVALFGPEIKISINGVVRLQTTDATLSGTKYGIGTHCGTAIRFDDMSFTKYIEATPGPVGDVVPNPTATVSATLVPTPTVKPTVAPGPTVTPRPTVTSKPTATPRPTPTPLVLFAPSNLKISLIAPTRVQLTWTDTNTNERGYNIERSTNPTSGFNQVATNGVNSTVDNVGNLKRNTTYYFRVRARGGNSIFSPYSNTVSITTPR